MKEDCNFLPQSQIFEALFDEFQVLFRVTNLTLVTWDHFTHICWIWNHANIKSHKSQLGFVLFSVIFVIFDRPNWILSTLHTFAKPETTQTLEVTNPNFISHLLLSVTSSWTQCPLYLNMLDRNFCFYWKSIANSSPVSDLCNANLPT